MAQRPPKKSQRHWTMPRTPTEEESIQAEQIMRTVPFIPAGTKRRPRFRRSHSESLRILSKKYPGLVRPR